MSYKDIAEKYSIKNNNMFTKLTTGIYCAKIDQEHTLGLLIDKSIEDFKKIYEKSKKNKLQNLTKYKYNYS